MSLSDFKKRFDPQLQKLLSLRIEESLKDKGNLSFSELWKYPLVLTKEGKRLRPYLAYLGYTAVGGKSEDEIMRVAVGLELFHTFCLVHDDIMDQDIERRGVSTTHTYYAEVLNGKIIEAQRVRVAESLALLLGDALFAWSRELLSDSRIADRLQYMIDEVILGQGIDTVLLGQKTASREELDHMMLMKTAGYSFVRPLQIGGALAGMDSVHEEFFARFGAALGIAFQLQDDYFDRETDRVRDRPTYYTRGYEAEGLQMMEQKFQEAEQILLESALAPEHRTVFEGLLQKVRDRKE